MPQTFVRGRVAVAALAGMVLAPAAQAQTAPSGALTTPSGSYLNLQPRRQRPQPSLVAPGRRPAPEAPAAQQQGRQVVCGMTVLTPPPGMDEAMVKPVPKDGPRSTMRTVDPPICGPRIGGV